MKYLFQLLFCSLWVMIAEPATAQLKFKDVTKKAGLLEPLGGMMGHNACWGDVNGDGYPDLFFGTFSHYNGTDYNVRGHQGGASPNKLLINQGDGTFREVKDSPLRVHSWNSGAAFADFDNDGDLDLVVSHQHHIDKPYGKLGNFLFENDGKGNFKDVTSASNLYFEATFLGRNTFVFDYDGDGLLDLFMQEDFALWDVSGGNSRLMKNTGGLVFKDVTTEAGFPAGFQQGLYGLGGFVDDINGDTWPDVFFAHSCRMFINNQDGTFHEKKYAMIPEEFMRPSNVNDHWTCGANTGDLDNDGDLDMVMGDHFFYDTSYHKMYVFLNEGNDASGDPILREVTEAAGIDLLDGRLIHIQIADADNDGRPDILTSRQNSFIFRNLGVEDGIPRFEKPFGIEVEGSIGYWAGGPFVDYDRDGRLDFIGPEWYPVDHSPLLRNVSRKAKNYIDIGLDLEYLPNRNGIGALVEVFEAGSLGREEARLGSSVISVSNGYSSGYEALVHFGLPENKSVDIRVSMPCGGPVIVKEKVSRNQRVIITK